MSDENRKFLQSLTKISDCTFYQLYSVAGTEWYGRGNGGNHDTLYHHPAEGVILEIRRAYEGDGFVWEWSLKLADGIYARHTAAADGIYARHTAAADSVEAAAAAAIAYAPRLLTFDHVDQTTWYETAEGRFYSVLDGEAAEISKPAGGDRYYWKRSWAPVAVIADAVKGYGDDQLSGTAATPEAAMIACIEAPQRIRSACAALIAILREPGTPAPDAERARFRAALDEIAHSNRTKTGLKEIARAALFPNEEAA